MVQVQSGPRSVPDNFRPLADRVAVVRVVQVLPRENVTLFPLIWPLKIEFLVPLVAPEIVKVLPTNVVGDF